MESWEIRTLTQNKSTQYHLSVLLINYREWQIHKRDYYVTTFRELCYKPIPYNLDYAFKFLRGAEFTTTFQFIRSIIH
jgi:hypothetical protein